MESKKIFKNNAQLDVHEFKTVNSKGETTWIELRVTPLKDPNGVTTAALELAIPITERKQVEAALNESEARFREAFATAPDAFYISTLKEGKMIEVNEHFEKMFGYTRKEIIGKTSFQLGIWANPIDREKMLTQLKAEAKARNLEMQLVRKNGQVFPAQSSVSVLQSGNEQRLVGVIRDASNEKQAQEALKRSEKEYSSLFANMIDGFAYCKMINDENGKPVDFIYLQINDAFERITGLEREMVLGKRVTKAIPGIIDANPELFEIYGRVALTGKKEKFEVFFKPLSLWLNISVYSPAKGYFAAVFEDITERKNLEQSSAAERTLVNGVINSANSLIFSVDRNYCYTSFNNAHALGMKTIFGVDIQIGKNILNYMSVDIDREKAKINIDKALAGEQLVEESFSGDEKFSRNYFIISHSPIKNAEGEVTGVVIVSNDITEHKKTEEELKRNQAKMEIINEKLNVVGRLTRHDVGNKLMVIKSNLYLLKKQIGGNPNLAKYLESMDSAINQSDEMFEFSRIYEKIGAEKTLEIDVTQCLNQAITLLPNLGIIKIVNECQGLKVIADSLLKQLFYNLLDNSLKHGEKVTEIRLHFSKKEDDGVKLVYEDNGVGIPLANKSKLFHEGFSTGKGTGFGLSLIKKMIEVNGWTITEEGEPNKGAKFVITIPN